MARYTRVIDKHGVVRFKIKVEKHGMRLIAQDKVPLPVLEALEKATPDASGKQTVDDSGAIIRQFKQALPDNVDCLFCGAPGNRRKFVELRVVRLCEEHWQTKTTGEIIGQLRDPK